MGVWVGGGGEDGIIPFQFHFENVDFTFTLYAHSFPLPSVYMALGIGRARQLEVGMYRIRDG